MKLYKLVIWSGNEEYETKEFIISEDDFKKYQNVIVEGREFLVLDDKIIKTKQIKEVLPATNRDIKEFDLAGRIPSEYKQLSEPTPETREDEEKRREESIERGLKNLGDWVRNQPWFKKKNKINEEAKEMVSINDLGED